MRLNLGAGHDILPNAVNHDVTKHRPEIDVVHDLNVLPWPWPDNTFDTIVAKSVFEHLQITLIEAMDECWRILQLGGVLFVKVPYWQGEQAWMDPQHRWRWAPNVFDWFDPETRYGQEYDYYTPRKWRIVKPAELNKAQSSIHCSLKVRK